MTNAKIDFSFGSLSFSGEGAETWLASQLDKILEAAPRLSELHAPTENADPESGDSSEENNSSINFNKPLASYLKEKDADRNQTKRFLAAADWLRIRGNKSINTSAVTKALSDNQQKRLGNPADCLNKNVSKGFCEKTKDGFFITPQGLESLGHKI